MWAAFSSCLSAVTRSAVVLIGGWIRKVALVPVWRKVRAADLSAQCAANGICEQAPSMHDPQHPNQFALLTQRRFAPFFWTQFAGAANDNLFKFAFTVMVTYQLSVSWLPPSMAGLVIGALFILPFVLFSATSGQLTDKVDKTRMIRFVKNLEIAIMLLAAWGFVLESPVVLLIC